jgi:tetratricopeptide (TPR) repeat protein
MTDLKKILWRLLVAGIVFSLVVLTCQRNEVWRSGSSLWQDALAKSPGKARPHLNFARALFVEKGDEAGAEIELRKALEIKPYYPLALLELGIYYSKRGDNRQAISYYEKALSKYPDIYRLWYNLAISYEEEGMYGEAEAAYRRTLLLEPGFLQATIRLGHLLRKTGREGEMIELMREAVKKNPELLDTQPYLREML